MPDSVRDQLQASLGSAYTIESELGGGGMSRVFVAMDTALSRRVVVKVLPPEMAAGLNTERFRREIQLAAGLQHPHIVPVLSAGDAGGTLYYTMPFVEGESLRGLLTRRRHQGMEIANGTIKARHRDEPCRAYVGRRLRRAHSRHGDEQDAHSYTDTKTANVNAHW